MDDPANKGLPLRGRFRRLVLVLIASISGVALTLHAVRGDDVTPLPDVVEADGSMGTCYTFYTTSGQPLPPYAYRAGSRWDRVDVRWNQIELSPGVYDFGPHEAIIDLDKASSIEFIGILGSPSEWATSGCSSVTKLPDEKTGTINPLSALFDSLWWRPCPPVNLHLEWNHPDNYWGDYVYETADYFESKVQVWEIWNEPDLGDVYWTGTAAEYAELLKDGYQAVKAANPNATVLMAGMAYWSDLDFYSDVFNTLVQLDPDGSHNYFFDVFSLHLYSDVYNIGLVADDIQGEMAATVGQHPIWLTEIGVPLWDERPYYPGQIYDNSATIEESAAFIIQAYSEARVAGIEKFMFFRTHDEDMDETFGLLRNDLTLRPSYIAYQVAARYLHGENQITGPFTNGSIRRITYWGTPRGRIDVLWNTAGGSAVTTTHPAVLPTATLVDKRGLTQTLVAENGVYTLSLPAATANTGVGGKYIIGGAPYLLIQEDTGLPASSLRALPTTTYGSAITLTWDVTDTLSGPWYIEVDRASAENGPWTNILGWAHTRNGITQTAITAPDEGDWYFRARARDNVGNWESWPTSLEVSTTVNLSRTLAISLSTYIDANSSVSQDPGEGPPIQTTHIRLMTAGGELITQTTNHSWNLVHTVREGDYLIRITSTGLLPDTMFLPVQAGGDVLLVVDERGLKPVMDEVFVPLLLR
ncbi:MAG: cellulase family glycosylhydrolase [Anaerolineae bacterium]|nr:cellulase family glycosylhydrolase [Anaerolineae bacterium]